MFVFVVAPIGLIEGFELFFGGFRVIGVVVVVGEEDFFLEGEVVEVLGEGLDC